MSFPAALAAMLQAIGALFVFVAGYLALILSAIICLVIAELISERSRDVRLPDIKVRGVRRESRYAVKGA
jgi:hypothetical protein